MSEEARREIRVMIAGLPTETAEHLGSYLEEVWEQLDDYLAKDPVPAMFRRVIRLNERLDLQVIQEQERTRQAELEVLRLEQLNAAEKLVLEKERLVLQRDRLKVWGGVAGKAVMAFAGAGGIGTAIVAALGSG